MIQFINWAPWNPTYNPIMFKLHVPIFYRNKYQMALEWRVCINFAKPKERERERDKCFVAPISLQQRKHFIAIKALSDLANGGSADSNEAHTYHCSRYAKLLMKKLVW